MTRVTFNWAIRLLGLLVAGLFILGTIVIWRLASGPVSLEFLTPNIEEAINPPESPYIIDVGDTQLVWAGWDRAIDIVAQDVAISRRGDASPLVRLPSVSIGLSMRAAAQGRVRLTSIDIIGPGVSMMRREDGSFSMIVGEEGGTQSSGTAFAAFEMLRSPIDEANVLGAVRRVSILDGHFTLVDQASDTVWQLEKAALTLTRSDHVLFSTFTGDLATARGRARLNATAQITHGDTIVDAVISARDLQLPMLGDLVPALSAYRLPGLFSLDMSGEIDLARVRHEGKIEIRTDYGRATLDGKLLEQDGTYAATGSIESVNPTVIAQALPTLEWLGALDMPLAASFETVGSLDGTLESAHVRLTGGKGRLTVPDLLPEPVPVSQAFAAVTISAGGAVKTLDHLWLDLDGPKVMASAEILSAAGEGGVIERTIGVDAALLDMTLDRLDGLWPVTLAVDARNWVVPNIPSASAPQSRIAVHGTMTGDDPGSFSIDSIDGEIEFYDAVVDYLNPMRPAEGVAGLANFGFDHFDLVLYAGSVGDITMKQGDIRIAGLSDGTERIEVDLDLDSEIRSALELLNTDPYRLVDGLGLDPSALSGHAAVEASFAFPLSLGLTERDVQFDAVAGLGDVRMPLVDFGSELTANALSLRVVNTGLDLSGPVEIDSIPASVSWQEAFGESVDPPRRIRANSHMPVEKLSKWGVNTFDVATGSTQIILDYAAYRSGLKQVSVDADLNDIALQLPVAGFEKPAGLPGKLAFQMTVPPAGPIDMTEIQLATGNLAVMGSARFAEGFSQLIHGRADSLAWGKNRLALMVTRTGAGGYRLDVEGPYVDLGPYLQEEDPAEEAQTEEEEPGPEIEIVAAIDTLIAGEARKLENVKIDLRHDGVDIDKLLLNASVGNGEELKIAYWPSEAGRHDLRVSSGDAGQALRALDWTDRIDGGVLELTGIRATPEAALDGQISVDNFTLTRAPVLAKLLEFMSLTGILSALGESGLSFDKLEGEFSYLDGGITLRKARAYGASVGITARGTANFDSTEVDIEGTIAPMYTISRILENIPIINIIAGGEEGLFGANFKVLGPAQDADISVNPLSALAPGFLRTLFNQLPEGEVTPLESSDPLEPSSDR